MGIFFSELRQPNQKRDYDFNSQISILFPQSSLPNHGEGLRFHNAFTLDVLRETGKMQVNSKEIPEEQK